MTARCVGMLSKIATMETMNVFLEHVLPWLGAIDDNTKQEGAIEAMACILCMSQIKICFLVLKMPVFHQGVKLDLGWIII